MDDLTKDAIKLVVAEQKASTSLLQRHFKIGYNRAERIMAELENLKVVGEFNGVRNRVVFVKSIDDLGNVERNPEFEWELIIDSTILIKLKEWNYSYMLDSLTGVFSIHRDSNVISFDVKTHKKISFRLHDDNTYVSFKNDFVFILFTKQGFKVTLLA